MSQPRGGYRNLFLLLCAGCALATTIYGIIAARRLRPSPERVILEREASPAETAKASTQSGTTADHATSTLASGGSVRSTRKNDSHEGVKPVLPASTPRVERAPSLVYFRANALGDNYSKLSVARIDELDKRRYSAELSCDRVHFANGRGVCLTSDRGVFTTYFAVMFDEQLRRGWTTKLDGFPSRVRVSPSGRLAAVTVFLLGHSYASLNFSTRTTIMDVDRGEVLADLDKFHVFRNGATYQSPDFNFWGVTFAQDENRFYATLWSKGNTYLVECDFAKRTANVIYDGVECPSLSPDNMRIAFKKRTGPITWKICLLELKTLVETPLGETRSVDDQVEWLDNGHILYALSENEKGASASTDIWVLPAAGGFPKLFLTGAFSPAVAPARN